MDKSLYLNWAGFMHTGKFLKGKFSCSYHPGRPLICQEFHSFRTSYSHLRAGMKVKFREFFFQKGKYSHILDDHCIQACIVVWFQIGNQFFF